MNMKEEAIGNVAGNVVKNIKNTIDTLDIGKAIKKQTGHTNIREPKKQTAVNPILWSEYNYPPLLRLYHYQEEGIREPTLGVIKKMKLAANLIVIC